MLPLTVKDIAKAIKGTLINCNNIEAEIKSVQIDSRNVEPSTLFVPLKGSNTDGHFFIDSVTNQSKNIFSLCEIDHKECANSKNIILTDNNLKALQTIGHMNRIMSSAKIIGITGSNGKTTTKNIISAMLSQKHSTVSTMGNFNNHIGLPLSLTKIDKKSEFGVFEVGISNPGEMDVLSEILIPEISIITSIGPSHIENLKSLDNIKKEKAKITYNTRELSLINGDIENFEKYVNQDIKYFTFGVGEHNDFQFSYSREDGFLCINYTGHQLKTNFIGSLNVYNIFAAVSLMLVLGFYLKDIEHYLKNVYPEEGRLFPIKIGNNLLIDDSYNANPASVENLLLTVENIGILRPKIVILGEMKELGVESETEHKKITQSFLPSTQYILKGEPYKKIFLYEKKENVTVVNSNGEIIDILNKSKLNNHIVAVKGSHSTNMKEIVEYLKGGAA